MRRSGWQRHFGEIEALPRGGRPIGDWGKHDHACFDVEEGLRRTIAEVRRMLAMVERWRLNAGMEGTAGWRQLKSRPYDITPASTNSRSTARVRSATLPQP